MRVPCVVHALAAFGLWLGVTFPNTVWAQTPTREPRPQLAVPPSGAVIEPAVQPPSQPTLQPAVQPGQLIPATVPVLVPSKDPQLTPEAADLRVKGAGPTEVRVTATSPFAITVDWKLPPCAAGVSISVGTPGGSSRAFYQSDTLPPSAACGQNLKGVVSHCTLARAGQEDHL